MPNPPAARNALPTSREFLRRGRPPRELLVAVTDLEPLDADAADVAGALPRLPALEALLARAERAAASPEWRRWALGHVGLEAPAGDLPVGAALAAAAGLAVHDASWLLATPVHLQATLTHVRLHAAGPLPLAADAAAALATRARAELGGDGFELHAVGEQLLARFAPPVTVVTHDPAAQAGREIGARLPGGVDGGRVRRCMTELQMWLHERPLVARAGEPAPNALWLWGAGRELPRGAARWPLLETDDAWLQALHSHAGAGAADGQRRLETWRLASLAGAGADDTFARAEREWFVPLSRALAAGELARVRLYLAGTEFDLRPAQRWRVWRRPRPWWELAA